MKRRLLAVLAITASLLSGVAGAGAAKADTTVTVSVPGTQPWTDTGISLNAGDSVSVTASGTIYIAGSDPGKTPAGAPGCVAANSATDTWVAPGLTCWSMIGRIGNDPAFEVGTGTTFTAASSGELFLGVNDDYFPDNSGVWSATITLTSPSLVILSPPTKSGPPGTLVQWKASGLQPGLSVSESVASSDGHTYNLGTYTTSSSGDIYGQYVIPCTAKSNTSWTFKLSAPDILLSDSFTATAAATQNACRGLGAGIIPYPIQGTSSLTSAQLSADLSFLQTTLQGIAAGVQLSNAQLDALKLLDISLAGCLPDPTPNNFRCGAFIVGAVLFLFTVEPAS